MDYRKNRELDGIYFRVKRNNKWNNICFSDLTENEMNEIMKDKNIDWVKSLCIVLAKMLRHIGDKYDIDCSGN